MARHLGDTKPPMPNTDDPLIAAAEARRRKRRDHIYRQPQRGWTETPYPLHTDDE